MISNTYGLNGKFKIDTYTKDNQLKNTTDWFENFISPTGLSYLFYLSPADCFRYISLGSGNTANTILGNGTTGLATPLNRSGFSYVGGAADSLACNGQGEAFNRYLSGGCGYRIDNSGVVLNRAWRIPNTDGTFFSSPFLFKEYMLTPSCPVVTGLGKINFSDVATIPTGICGCGWQPGSYTYSGDGTTILYGKENWELYNFYKNREENAFDLCSGGIYAFTRIIKDITVVADEYIVVNYSLTINYNTGVQTFSLVPSILNPVASADPQNWENDQSISGIYSLIHPGIKLVNGTYPSYKSYYITDIRTDYQPLIGESFVPPLGNSFEAACNSSLIKCYISSDALQFLVNDLSGGAMDTGAFKPYNSSGRHFPSGVQAFHKNWLTETSSSALGDALQTYSSFPNLVTPRHQWTNDSAGISVYPDETNYKTAVKSSEILDGTFTPTTLVEAEGSDAIETYVPTGRSRSIIRSFQFVKYDLSDEFPVRSVVIAYNGGIISADVPRYFPFVDLCFSPTSGTGRMPTINRTGFTYEAPLSRINTPTYNSGYSFMDDSHRLTLQFKVSWSSPCSSEVVGC